MIRAQPYRMMLLCYATSHPHNEEEVAKESAINDDCSHVLNSSSIRLFNVPTLNLEANAYHELAYSDCSNNFQHCKPDNNLQQLFKAASLAAKNSHLFHLVLYYFAMKSVLTPPSLCRIPVCYNFFVFNLKTISHQTKIN